MNTHYDIDTVNDINAEEKYFQREFRKEHNRIMAMRPGPRKQEAYNKLYAKGLALQGLTEKQLTQPY